MKLTIVTLLLCISAGLFAQKNSLSWPREIEANNHLITLYQPQPETFKGNILTGRMALSIKNNKGEMIFGALWYEARLATDFEERTATMEKMTIIKVKFPDIEDDSKLDNLKNIITSNFENLDLTMSIDKILSTLETVDEANLNNDFKNDAPTIYYRTEGTVLVNIDGKPILKKAENSNVETVVNTPFFIAKNDTQFFLKGGDFWYSSEEIVSESWKPTTKIPAEVQQLAKQQIENSKEDSVQVEDQEKPTSAKIIVSTTPSELIISDGELAYEPIKETSLLYVTNTESDIIMDITSQNHFLLLNGRWYSSKTLKDGDWKFIEPDALPKDFTQIPDSSALAAVRYSVPGTVEALEAKYEQYMPQTAVIDKKTATAEVTYDGKPQLEKIEGTDLSYAINTESAVLKMVAGKYYMVDNGVWFISSRATGPWKVSDRRPEQVEKIPSSYPVYNLKYVYIYESTPEVVYVGYTPGYYNSYIYGGVVVYGTGYYYQPWYGVYYYPRPITYGYGVHYNPYTGWGFSVGVSYGWMTVSFHRRSYWGAGGYHHGYRHGYHHGYHHGYSHGARRGYAAGYAHANRNNAYQNRSNGVNRTGNYNRNPSTQPKSKPGNRPSTQPSKKPNNVYSDKKGNVHQRDKSGNWEQKHNKPLNKPSTQPKAKPQQKPNTQQKQPRTQQQPKTQQKSRSMEQQHNNRSRGNSNYQRQSRGSYGGGRSMPRGGGGRRR